MKSYYFMGRLRVKEGREERGEGRGGRKMHRLGREKQRERNEGMP